MRTARRSAVAALGAASLLSLSLTATGGSTYAAFSDFADVHASASAGVWAPDPPAECGPLSDYSAVLYGTPGNDTLVAPGPGNNGQDGNKGQILMGYGGDDTLIGGNGKDCLVGGAGEDTLIAGNGKDILLGGDGDDALDGGNGKDTGNTGGDNDACDGGRGKNTIASCGGGNESAVKSLTSSIDDQIVAPDDSTLTAAEASGAVGQDATPDAADGTASSDDTTTAAKASSASSGPGSDGASESPAEPPTSESKPDSEEPAAEPATDDTLSPDAEVATPPLTGLQ